jgi:cbb3-type cytochrome oxidase maturation protein
MEVIRGLIPLMIILGFVGVVIFFWTVRSGQYDDLEGDANRILMDDDDPMLPENKDKAENKRAHDQRWPDAD